MSIRVFLVALTVVALWWSSNSFGRGLGLGDLNVTSNLAAPLKARVTLRGMDGIDLNPENFSIRIDSDSKTKIEYRLLRMDADTAIIDLYTRKLISDPLFQLRIEVKWEGSAVARSYDVLIDPPAYQELFRVDEKSESAATGISNAEQANEQKDLSVQRPVAPGDALPVVIEVAESAAGKPAESADSSNSVKPHHEYGPTNYGDSIWKVARAMVTDKREPTVYQWMYAIWKANPQAFIRDNMHRLKSGEVLSIPQEDEATATSRDMAWSVANKQMSLLSTGMPAGDATQAAASVDSDQQNVSPPENALEVPAQQAGHDIAIELVPVDDSGLVAEQQLEDPAVEVLIADLDKSVSTIDEEPVVAPGAVSADATTQDTLAFTRGGEVEIPQVVSIDGAAETPVVEASEVGEIGALAALTNGGPVILDSLDAVTAGDRLFPNSVREETVADIAPLPASSSGPKMGGWFAALRSRHEAIDQLPVIGAGGSLAFVGRALQRIDRFVATSPSWAALAFGATVSLVLMLLRQEWLARRAAARAAKLSVAEPAATHVASTAEYNNPDMPIADQTVPKSVSGEGPKPANQVRTKSSLLARSATSNASEIIAQANAILSQGDIEEAIKLMRLAVELQPHQPTLVMLLLELYHKTRRAVFFAELLEHSRSVLETLGANDQLRLRAMHAQLCPDSAFLPGQGESAEDALPAAVSSAAISVANPESNVDSPSRLHTDDTVTTSADDFDILQFNDDLDNKAFVETQVIYTDSGVPLLEEATPMAGLVGENIDLDMTLKEADVFLAYGLYENAEDLLLKGMEVDPQRADILARLLDCYYAMRSVVDFASCAKIMLDMGDAGSEYWEKVEIMGFELAPNNKMFAGGKDRSLSTGELEIARPETTDFDFSDIAGNNPAAWHDIEIEESSETALSDIEISENNGDKPPVADLNLDLQANESVDSVKADPGDLASDREQLQDRDVPGIADGEVEFEIDLEATNGGLDAALSECLNTVGDEPDAVLAAELYDDDESLDFVIEDAEQVTMDVEQVILEDDIEPGPNTTTADGDDVNLALVDESTLESSIDGNPDSGTRRILYFPDSSSEGKGIDEFESEVEMRLQAIRDQLQYMTERLFRQERATNDLQQTMAELQEAGRLAAGTKIKKSS